MGKSILTEQWEKELNRGFKERSIFDDFPDEDASKKFEAELENDKLNRKFREKGIPRSNSW